MKEKSSFFSSHDERGGERENVYNFATVLNSMLLVYLIKWKVLAASAVALVAATKTAVLQLRYAWLKLTWWKEYMKAWEFEGPTKRWG